MVSWEFEKPATCSIGKKVAVVALIFLLIGAFLSFSICTPIITIALIVFLLYLQFDIYLEKKDETRVKINHFILILWGALYLFSSLSATFVVIWMSQSFMSFPITWLAGLVLLDLGYLLCIIAGVLEWRYPSKAGPRIKVDKKKEKEVLPEVIPKQVSEVPTNIGADKEVKPMTKEDMLKEEHKQKPEQVPITPSAESEKIEMQTREPTSEEEKVLQRWARHINESGETFEQCIKCQNYVFVKTKDTGEAIIFKCPDCGTSFTLKK
ncbi:MAG: hypothetical protein JSV09_05925 [Thermoplasmata archaeon]|nr:MAG: hypothetical protein JSV09_05925 [Thermoplasmata archaeon]